MTAAADARLRARAEPWWQRGVVYQIYTRSFADTNGDGVGDLPGIIEHLDHLRGAATSLDVDAILLAPFYPSAGMDLGYDVSDHTRVDPQFGSFDDFGRLLSEAHRRGLAVILDLVLNHTSDRHPWFLASRTSRSGPHADWYLWRDAAGFDRRGRPRPPNNWVSFFGGSAWTWEPRRSQFFLHTFLPQQPDVNWRAPGLRAAQLDVLRRWIARGADGFRLDVFNCFLKHASFPHNPRAGLHLRDWDRQLHVYDQDQPQLVEILAEIRRLFDSHGVFSFGESFCCDSNKTAGYSAPGHLVLDNRVLVRPWDAAALARAIDEIERAYGPNRWPTVALSNQDRPRHASRLARLTDNDAVAKAAALLLLSLRGTPFLYYGEELGLRDIRVWPWQIVDRPARRAWPLPVWWNRDGCRAPLPWSDADRAGFSTARPWLPLPADWRTRNVARQAADPGSVLAFYRRLLRLRRSSDALQVGEFAWHTRDREGVLAYFRRTATEQAMVAINTRRSASAVALPPRGTWQLAISTAETSIREMAARPRRLSGSIPLAPYEAILCREVAGHGDAA